MKNQIIGVWRHEDIEYTFHQNNKMNILWRESGAVSKGSYMIEGKIITFSYGRNNNETWQGEIQSVSNSTLSILDLTEELNKVDTLEKIYPLFPIEQKLSKYIFENISLVFLIIVFYQWISNLGNQVENIFNIYPGGLLYYLLIGIIGLTAILIFILSVNSTISIVKYGFSQSIKKINKTSLKFFLLKSPSNFIGIISDKFENEKENKFYIPFWVLSSILILFISGSPIINNYIGVYVSFEVPQPPTQSNPDGGTTSTEIPGYVFNKNDKKLIEQKIKKAYKEIIVSEDDGFEDLEYDVSSRGYLFEQTAIIEGYKSYNNRYRGFYDYVSALVYFLLEKLIIVLIWVLLPFLTCVAVVSFRNKLD